jgi:hypothetical protein
MRKAWESYERERGRLCWEIALVTRVVCYTTRGCLCWEIALAEDIGYDDHFILIILIHSCVEI